MMSAVDDGNRGDLSNIHKCHHCDELVVIPELSKQEQALCPRCGSFLRAGRVFSYEQLFCISLTALILLLGSLPYGFISLNANGNETTLSLIDSVRDVYHHDHALLAITLFFAIVAIPAFTMVCAVALFGILWLKRATRIFPLLYKVFAASTSWMMVEVFVLGVLISLLKISALATVQLGTSFYLYCLFVMFAGVTMSQMDRELLWENWLEIRKTNRKPS